MNLTWDIDFVYRAFLILTRLGALLFFLPIFEGRGVPTMVRAGFAVMFAYLTALVVPGRPPLPAHAFGLVTAGLSELMVGMFMGLSLRIAFQTMTTAGELIAIKAGFMRDASFDPFTQTSNSAVEKLLTQFAVVIFLTSGLHLQVFASFIQSFEVAHLGQWAPSAATINALIWQTSQIFLIAVQIAAPFIAMHFIINMAFAVLGKAAPQINVFVISFAVIIICGLLVLAMTTDMTAQHIIETLRQAVAGLVPNLAAK